MAKSRLGQNQVKAYELCFPESIICISFVANTVRVRDVISASKELLAHVLLLLFCLRAVLELNSHITCIFQIDQDSTHHDFNLSLDYVVARFV